MIKKTETDFNLNDAKVDQLAISEFDNRFLKLYSGHSNVRGIPFIGDGFKEAQRKALWGVLERGEHAEEITVERLGAHCAAVTDYHHGIGSMQGTIVGLAQDFAGSNNLSLLHPEGQFGSRLSHSASAPRYIYTRLHENFRQLFKKDDDVILDRKLVGDIKIEPKYFIPILPIVLLNGAEGMGTGHATHIFSYSPSDLKKAILAILDGKQLKDFSMVPYWNGFRGTISRDKTNGQVLVTGAYKVENTTTIRITELPIGVQSDQYEKYLFKLIDKDLVKRFDNQSDDDGFDISIIVPRTTSYQEKEELIKLFKLEARDTENLTVWGPKGEIVKYDSAEKLLVDFVAWRLERYEERRQKHIAICKEAIAWLSEMMRFILYYLKHSDTFRKLEDVELFNVLTEQKFTQIDRLLALPIRSLTKNKIDELQRKLDAEKEKLKGLQSDTADEMYRRELKELKFTF